MDKTEFIKRIQAIGSCEDTTNRLELLAQLQDDATPDYDKLNELETKNTQLSTDNETLRQANMKMFLRLGEQREPEDKTLKDDKPEKRKFEDLFNEKGEIK